MENDLLGKQLESAFGLTPGSLTNITPDNLTPILADNVKSKTNELTKQLKKHETLTDLPVAELVKNGISLEQLEDDRLMLRNEAFEIYRIGKALLMKLYKDVENQIGVNDRMYTACAKMLDSVNGSVIKLFEMNQKLKQDEEFKVIASVAGDDSDKSKTMSTQQWLDWVDAVKDDETPTTSISKNNVVDADIK